MTTTPLQRNAVNAAKKAIAEGRGYKKAQWRVNTPQLLREVLVNNETKTLRIPLQIFANILFEVGERASQLNDAKLNALMCRLAIYEASDPYSKEYDKELSNATIEAGR